VKHVFGGIEAGGTKFVCVVGSGPNDILAEARFPTTAPDETLDSVISFFERYRGVLTSHHHNPKTRMVKF
jgi:fructokinase